MAEKNQPVIEFYDVATEIFDMVKPATPEKITFADLVNWLVNAAQIRMLMLIFADRSGQADIVITLLTDFSGFNEYETKELVDSGDPPDIDDTQVPADA